MPLLNLALLELLLRAVGYGYSPSLFLPQVWRGRPVLIDNQKFARRYFPPGLERTPRPFVLPQAKPPGGVRLFVLGESAAMGDPEPAFGFARQLELMLREAWPGKPIEVVNVAVTAINSHVIREIARDCAGRQGDYWIVYMGNNEVVGPFGAGTVFGDQAPPLGFIRANLALKRLRLGQLVDGLRQQLFRKKGAPSSWEGMEMFLQQQVARADARMPRVHSHFEANLGAIVDLGRDSGARVLLATVASNLKDSAPFGSLHRPGLTPAERTEWDRFYDAGVGLEEAGQPEAALTNYLQAARLDTSFAALAFRRGRCALALGEAGEARRQFVEARDLDTLRFRADSRINEIIRDHAAHSPGTVFIDAEALVATNSPHGIAGGEFFHEHVHFNFAGNHLLARALARGILESAGADEAALASLARMTEAECVQRLGFTDYEHLKVLEEVSRRLAQPPFTGQAGHAARTETLQRQITQLSGARRPESYSTAAATYRAAIARWPDDWTLREQSASYFQTQGHPAEAEEHWRKLIELLPHSEHPYYGLASTLDSLGRAVEAEGSFRAALQRRPGAVEALNGLGLSLAGQGRSADAISEYQRALRAKPEFAEARVNLGQLLARQGRLDEAETQYRETLRLQSNNVAARVNLGKLLVELGRSAEAIQQYQEAVRADPSSPVARYNLANSLGSQGDLAGAVVQYREAVRLSPSLAEAHYNLGLSLARLNQQEEALRHLGEAVRLSPSMAEARFNHGVALARARRFEEAIKEFQETLRLDPANAQARKFLDQATTLRAHAQ